MNNQLARNESSIVGAKSQFGGNSVIESGEMTTAMAEVQARVIMAKQFPRDITLVGNKIQAACERLSLAKVAEYQYKRGSTSVTGPSVKLLEVVAQCYGNLSYGWDCVHRDLENHISHCKAHAWDMENNIPVEITFDVPHVREKRTGNEILTNPRDIYELEANQAARRYRKCLEQIVPRDMVEQAVEWCNETLTHGVDIQKGIEDAITFFKNNYGIKIQQIEKYFGMSRQAFNKNQYLELQKIYASVRDGMSYINDFFPKEGSKEESNDEDNGEPSIDDKQVKSLCDAIVATGQTVPDFFKEKGIEDVTKIKITDYVKYLKELGVK